MSTSAPPRPRPYPVHVDADLDPAVSRGLWLVKWLLAIPHYVVLLFLWTAFALTTIIAFFAILFTGRYPSALFDFNVGVMRWSWRVSYYAYGALATDRYPPFTLSDVPDYPAHLEVERPERLSRGLVLVKWWLLAIPHYLVIALFVGGIGYGVRGADDEPLVTISLLGVLVLVAGVMLLFTGRYPRPLFDLVLGVNRWVLRVVAYVALMTDRYPPFALDQGGHERVGSGPDARPDDRPPPPPPGRSGWTTGRVVSLVAGSLLVLAGLGLVGAGATLVAADQLARDDDGFLTAPSTSLSADGFAITSTDMQIHASDLSRVPDSVIGDVRITAEGDGTRLFLGLAPTAAVDRYLTGVGHSTVLEVRDGEPLYIVEPGEEPEAAPAEQDFWTEQSVGTAPQVTWSPEDGRWTLVLMNADGSAAVAASVSAGAEVPMVSTIIAVLFVLAALALLAGALLVAIPVRAAGRRAA